MVRQHKRRRTGFTLIELLVVITIMALLAGMAVLIGNALFRSDKSQRAASTAAAAFQIAKQTSLRDRVVYGIRLVPDINGNFNGLEYIYQPPDYVDNEYINTPSPLGPIANGIQFDNRGTPQALRRDISGGLGPDKNLWLVQVGDFIQTENDPSPHLIIRVGPDPASTAPPRRALAYNEIEVAAPGTDPTVQTWSSKFRVMRSARPVPGEEIVRLPEGIIIDANLSRLGTNSLTPDPITGRVDVLFSPAQGVVGATSRAGKIILWVRDSTEDPATTKNQLLLVIFTRTGLVTSYPVDTSGRIDPLTGTVNPYSFTYDPRPTGL